MKSALLSSFTILRRFAGTLGLQPGQVVRWSQAVEDVRNVWVRHYGSSPITEPGHAAARKELQPVLDAFRALADELQPELDAASAVGSLMMVTSVKALDKLDAKQKALLTNTSVQERADLCRDATHHVIYLAAVSSEFLDPLLTFLPLRAWAGLRRALRKRPSQWTLQMDRKSFGATEMNPTILGWRVQTVRNRDRGVVVNAFFPKV